MASEIEYEKTYLLKSLPEGIENASSVYIRDVYIPDTANHAHLRLRQKDDNYVITKKYPVNGSDSSVQHEHTIELNKDEFEALADSSNKDSVRRRCFMTLSNRRAEVDIYGGKLRGLAIVDFEFNNEADKNAFNMPDFVLADVTQEELTAGGYISGKSIDDILPQLEKKYGYKKLEHDYEI